MTNTRLCDRGLGRLQKCQILSSDENLRLCLWFIQSYWLYGWKDIDRKNIDQTAPFALNFSSKNFVIILKAKKIYENHQTKTKFEIKLYRVVVYSFIVWNFNIFFIDILTLKLIFVPKISEPFLRGFRNRHWDLLVHEKLIFLAA